MHSSWLPPRFQTGLQGFPLSLINSPGLIGGTGEPMDTATAVVPM